MDVIRDSEWYALYKKYDNGERSPEILERLANYWWNDARMNERRIKARKEREERKLLGITKDEQWQKIYENSKESSTKLADSLWRVKNKSENIIKEKKEKSAKVINELPKQKMPEVHSKETKKKCQAVTMIGKPCPFKAVSECGRFCKKHSL